MKMALYGNDIDEETTPLEAGLGWVTKFKKDRFIGKEALAAQKEAGVKRALVAFKMSGRLIPRHGYPIVNEAGEQIGVVTSGTKSPSAGFGIGMAYVPTELKKIGTQLTVQVRQRTETAEVVKPPFVTPAPTLP
jgi:aminomethyltransferase